VPSWQLAAVGRRQCPASSRPRASPAPWWLSAQVPASAAPWC